MSRKMTPEQVLRDCKIFTRPVDPDVIIRHYGFSKVDLPGNADIFGAIVRKDGRVIIAVNPNQHPNRQRFTVAHELGHYFRQFCVQDSAEHVDGDFRLSWRSGASSTGVDWTEIEANRFAAALLMPEELLRRDIDFLPLDGSKIQRLASLYKVSRMAMQFRLLNLGFLPPSFDPSSAE